MKKLITLMALAAVAVGANAQKPVTSSTKYDFVKAGNTPAYSLSNDNYRSYFYSWEKEGKADSRRQDYKGYAVDEESKAAGLPDVCHTWVRNPRLVQNLSPKGFRFTGEKNFVVDGLKAGDKVVFEYTGENADSTKQKLVYATGASGHGGAHVGDVALVAGTSLVNSGDTLLIDSANYTNKFTEGAGYVSVLGYKNTYLQKVTVIGDTTLVYDFAKAGANISLDNNNCGWYYYAWEKEGKTDSRRQDYKGYRVNEKSQKAGLPDAANVWIRNPRLVQNITENGLHIGQTRNFVVDGLKAGDRVIINYEQADTTSADKQILYATSASARAAAHAFGVDSALVAGASFIASGDTIVVDSANFVNSKKKEDGYLAFLAYKGMNITSIITERDSVVANPAGVYDLAGVFTETPTFNDWNLNPSKTYDPFKINKGKGKENRQERNFRGYRNYVGSYLPMDANIYFVRPINLAEGGLTFANESYLAIDNLNDSDVITIEYTNADSASIVYAPGTDPDTAVVARLADWSDCQTGVTEIASGAKVIITKAGKLAKNNSYTCFRIPKNTVISKITVVNDPEAVATGIQTIRPAEKVVRTFDPNAPMYNLAGQRVSKSYKGVVIQNGRKFFQK